MSTTDPLREALTAAEHEMACAAQSLHDMDHCAECADIADDLAAACERARSALAAVPVEPEAWEYGFSAHGDVHEAYGRCATASEAQAMLATMSAGYQRRAQIVRRRPGTAPGPWERVDPEPREDDLDFSSCGDPTDCRAGTQPARFCICNRLDPEPRLQDGGE